MPRFHLRPSKTGEGFDLTEPGQAEKKEFHSMHSAFVYAKGRTRDPAAELVVCDGEGNILHRWPLSAQRGP